MKFHFLAVLMALQLCLTGMSVRAQQVDYSAFNDFNIRTGEAGVIGKSGNRYLTYRISPKEAFIDSWNEKMQPVATVILDFLPQSIYDCFFSVSGDTLAMLYQYTEGRNLYLYGALLDKDGRLLKRPVKLDEKRTGILGIGDANYRYLASEDHQKLAAYSLQDDAKKLESRIILMDGNLNILRKASPEYKSEDALLASAPLLLNSGKLVLPVHTQTGSRNAADEVMLLSFADSSRQYQVVRLPLEGHFMQEPFLKRNARTHELVVAGYYADSKNGSPEGILIYKLREGSLALTGGAQKVLFTEKLRGMTGNRSIRHAFANQHLRSIILKNDGGMVLVSEENYETVRTSYTPGWGYYSIYNPFAGGSPQVREFYYKDILLLSVLPDGTLEWPTFIRKDQYSQGDNGMFSGYFMVNTGAGLAFLYNNFNRSRSVIELVQVDAAGMQTQRSFEDETGDMPDWIPKEGKQVSAREVLVPCITRKKLCFAKVRF